MSRLFLLLLLVACEPKATEEQLVRQCQDRGGTPDLRGPVKCEMPQEQIQDAYAGAPVRHD